MHAMTFRSKMGIEYQVELPEPLTGMRSAFIFAYIKSGSTLLNNMITCYCQALGIPTFSLFNSAFDSGVPTHEIMKDANICFNKEGIIYTGFRHYPSFELDLKGIKCVLLVRDPRDMLVSLYYSIVKSHVIPKNYEPLRESRQLASQQTIDKF